MEAEIEFRTEDGIDVGLISVRGFLNIETVGDLGVSVRDLVPLEFDGHIVFDLRQCEDQLANEDVDLLKERIFLNRYFFRRPVAVIRGTTPVDRSRKYAQAALEREGILVRDFADLESAIQWLKSPVD